MPLTGPTLPLLKHYIKSFRIPVDMKTETKKKVLAYGMVGIMILVAVTVAASALLG